MGLLEKLKDTFFEEEYVEIEEKEDKKEKKVAKKVEERVEPRIEKVVEEKSTIQDFESDEDETLDDIIEDDVVSDRDIVNKNSKLTYFDDSDFEPTQSIPVVKEEPTRIYGETTDTLYSSIKVDDIKDYSSMSHRAYGATEENKFEPTPIISPIYGILDKNYRKEEVIDKKDRPSSYVSRKNVDLDSVRRKAYGDDAVATPVVIEEEIDEEPPVYNSLTDEIENIPAVDQVTVGDAEEYFNDLGLEYNIDYKDRHYENATGRRSDAYINEETKELYDEVIFNDNNSIDHQEDDNNITMDDLMSSQLKEIDQEEAHLEDNLFDLVDSLYEDGE